MKKATKELFDPKERLQFSDVHRLLKYFVEHRDPNLNPLWGLVHWLDEKHLLKRDAVRVWNDGISRQVIKEKK